MSRNYIIEVCSYGLESAQAAVNGGADRIELCENAFVGGTTPSYGMMKVVRKRIDVSVFTMIRPRGGDFLYTEAELKIMAKDIQMAKKLGMDGVVIGVLRSDGTLDMVVLSTLIKIARPLEVTLHRAFDLTPDPMEALGDALKLGVDRILTSGHQKTAVQGIPELKSLVEVAGDRLSIMPGSGINEDNLTRIISETGVREFHVSARTTRNSKMDYRPQDIIIGDPRSSEFSLEIVDADRVRRYRRLLENYSVQPQ